MDESQVIYVFPPAGRIIMGTAGLLGVLLGVGIYLILPRITRRGLLFGAYVGEERAEGEEARAITRSWYRGMWTLATLGIVAAVVSVSLPSSAISPALFATPILVVNVGYLVLYVTAYRRALRLAPSTPTHPAVAILEDDPRSGTLGPVLAIGLALAVGLASLVHAISVYPELPSRIPTHFGFAGNPDGWSDRSWATVLTPSLLCLVMGTWIALIALFTARAKRAVRADATGASLAAQTAFRRAMTRFLTTIAVLITVLTGLLNRSMLQVALGRSDRLTPLMMILAGVLVAFALVGTLVLGLRYGQGGARLERGAGAAGAPLTDGLADNRHWKLGMFYVNREDPSILVEHRFGIGYTINLGNARALALIGGGAVLALLLALLAVLTA